MTGFDRLNIKRISFLILAVSFLIIPISLISDAEPTVIDGSHDEMPLVSGATVSEVEVNDDGDVVFASYSNSGFSMLDLNSNTITHFSTTSTPALTSDFIKKMLYVPEQRCLYLAVSDQGFTGTSLDIYDRMADEIRTISISDIDLEITDMVYDPGMDKIYIGTAQGILIMDATDEAILLQIPIDSDQLQGGVVDLTFVPTSGYIYAAVVNGSSNYIQVIDTSTDMVVIDQDITISDGVSGVGSLLGWEMGPMTSIAVLEGRGEIYIGISYIYTGTGDETYNLMVYDLELPSMSRIINISLYQSVDVGSAEPEDFNFRSWTINDLVIMGNEENVAFASSGLGSGVIDTATGTPSLVLTEIPNLFGDNYYMPIFDLGSNDIEYNPITDTLWTSTWYSIGSFSPDDMMIAFDPVVDDDDDDDDEDKRDPERVDDLISIAYDDEDEERFYEDGDVITAGDCIVIMAFQAYEPGLEPVDILVLRLIDPLTGEVVKESVGDGFMVEMDLEGTEVSSSRYILKVEGQTSNGDVIYYSERDILVDNPLSRPISAALVGAGVGMAAAVGAGVAISSITTSATAQVGAASSTSAGTSTSTWKNLLFGFATEYSEEQLKERTGVKGAVGQRSERGFINPREIAVIAITVVFMMIAFGYVEMMDRIAPHSTINLLGIDIFAIPDFSLISFLIVLPMVLFTSVIVILTVEIAEEASAKMLGLWSEFRIWPIGLLTLLISSILLMPFGYPGRAIPKGDVKITPRMEGFIGSFVLTTMLVLCFPFSLLYLIGYQAASGTLTDILMSFGGLGLSILSMMLLAGALPFKPMDGRKVWRMNKLLSIAFIIGAAIIFWFWNFSFLLVPPFFSDWFVPLESWIGAMLMLLSSIAGGVVLLMMSAFGLWKGRDRGENDFFDEEDEE